MAVLSQSSDDLYAPFPLTGLGAVGSMGDLAPMTRSWGDTGLCQPRTSGRSRLTGRVRLNLNGQANGTEEKAINSEG